MKISLFKAVKFYGLFFVTEQRIYSWLYLGLVCGIRGPKYLAILCITLFIIQGFLYRALEVTTGAPLLKDFKTVVLHEYFDITKWEVILHRHGHTNMDTTRQHARDS